MTAEVLEYAYNITRMFPFNTLKNLKDLRQEDFPFSGVGTHDLYICISICILGLALPLQNLGEGSGSLLRADLGDPKQKECCRILRSFGKMCA